MGLKVSSECMESIHNMFRIQVGKIEMDTNLKIEDFEFVLCI